TVRVTRMPATAQAATPHPPLQQRLEWTDTQLTLAIHEHGAEADLDIALDGQRVRVAVYRQGETLDTFTPQGKAQAQCVDPLRNVDQAPAHGGRLTAQVPGKGSALLVEPGQ